MRKHLDEDLNGQADATQASKPASAAASPPLLLTEEQAAEVLSLSPRKVWELAACGAIKCVKIGTLKRYRRIDLEAWVAKGCPTS